MLYGRYVDACDMQGHATACLHLLLRRWGWRPQLDMRDLVQETLCIFLEVCQGGGPGRSMLYAANRALGRLHRGWIATEPLVTRDAAFVPAYDRQIDGALCLRRLQALYHELSSVEQAAVPTLFDDTLESVTHIARTHKLAGIDVVSARTRVLRRLRQELR